jgi:hypothetical protein
MWKTEPCMIFFMLIYFRTMMVSVFTVPNADYFANYWLSAIVVDPLVANGLTRDVAIGIEEI